MAERSVSGKAIAWLEAKYGHRLRAIENPVSPTVGLTATLVGRNNPDRFMFLAVNLSGADGYLGFDNQVSASKGILISGNGGNINLLLEEDGTLVTREIYAINPAGAGTWLFIEVEAV